MSQDVKDQSRSMKKQTSILDFTKKSEISNASEPEFVDLTGDSSVIKNEDQDLVSCPVCQIIISCFSMNDRIKHVEECLSISYVKENFEDEQSVKKRKIDTSSSSTSASGKKNVAKKIESPKSLKQRYINKDSNIKKPRLASPSNNERQPKNVDTPIRIDSGKPIIYKRRPIPDLKILNCKVSINQSYLIAVDAFNFRPHYSISKYFLSHFHSDHYGGISKKWCSEGLELNPNRKQIYCSVITGRLLRIRFNIDPTYIRPMKMDKRYLVQEYDDWNNTDDYTESESNNPGLYVTLMTANHCPGAAIFLFESIALNHAKQFMLHCGDFRVNKDMIEHPALRPFHHGNDYTLDKLYLDTTYMSRNYNFPKQELVCEEISEMFYHLIMEDTLFNTWFGTLQSRITDFLSLSRLKKKKILILVGTYLIGKERVAISILKRLNNIPIFVSNIKSRGDKNEILRSYDDSFLNSVITDDDLGLDSDFNAVIHLVPMDIVNSVGELSSYFNHNQYFNHFERCIGLRPSGWTFTAPDIDKFGPQEPNQTSEDDTAVVDDVDLSQVNKEQELSAIVNTLQNAPMFNYVEDVLKQFPLPNKSTRSNKKNPHDNSLYKIYGLPYSEHSSYRELSFFVIFLQIGQIIPTVNTHNEWSVKRMDDIINLWLTIKEIKFEKSNINNHKVNEDLLNSINKLTLDDF